MAKLSWADEHKVGIIDGVDEKIVKGLRDKFQGETNEVGMYLSMSRLADREGYPEIARVLEKIAYEEAEHAARFGEMLGEEILCNNTKDNLIKMIKGENGACQYKKDIATWAKEQGLDAIHDSVHEMAKDEARHGMALEGMLKRYFNEEVQVDASADPIVCNCKKVKKSQILAAIAAGATTVEAVGEATGAGTGCGGCKPKIQALLS